MSNERRTWDTGEIAYWALLGSPRNVVAERLMFAPALPRVGESVVILPYEGASVAAMRKTIREHPNNWGNGTYSTINLLGELDTRSTEIHGEEILERLFSMIEFHNTYSGTYRVTAVEHVAEPCFLELTHHGTQVTPLNELSFGLCAQGTRTQTDLPHVYLRKVRGKKNE